jgi:hypothetical protein
LLICQCKFASQYWRTTVCASVQYKQENIYKCSPEIYKCSPPPPPPPPAIQTFHTGMQLPEKYKENFDVSSEGLCQEVSRHQVVLVLCQTGKFGNCMSEITKIWTPKFLGKREIIFNYFRKYINCIWNEIASLLLYIWHFGQFDGVPGWMKMS